MSARHLMIFVTAFANFLLVGCASDTPYLDAHFGQASEKAQTTQAINGKRATPSAQMEAQALHNGMSNYMGDRAPPQAIRGILNSSAGGASGQ